MFGDRQMPSTGGRSAAHETDIAWDEAAAFLRRRLQYQLSASGRDAIDDLVQEALVRLLRAVRREPVENLEALMTEIARRTAIDWLRRRTRWNLIVDPANPSIDGVADPKGRAEELGDPVDRLSFVVVEFFGARESACRDLAIAYFERQDWKAVAEARGRSHDAIRKQWSRCLELLRAAARSDRGPLMEWSR